ncbi:MAG: ACP S-malonyltransferase [Candidatus Cloacimonetes bacterium]|nr:ACP S-malonyltransferase [Candidatus Cloacimonadota bacterium]
MTFTEKEIAFVFPGQGAQYIGMAMDFTGADIEMHSVLRKFDEKHSTQLERIMTDGPEEELKQTKYTQPAILFHSYCAWKTFIDKTGIKPAFVAGHSLGEFSALVANGVLSVEDAMHLVHKRGQFMIEANAGNPFAMYAIMGLDSASVKAACAEASDAGVVIAANFNTPDQTVISGSEEGVKKAGEICKAKGAKRALPLQVGGPFHSPLIEKAGFWLADEMKQIHFNDTDVPVVSNVDAKPTGDSKKIIQNLTEQVTSSVLWVDCIQQMINDGVKVFFEFGPQKVLSGMIKKIDKNAIVYNIDKLSDIERVIEEMKNAE